MWLNWLQTYQSILAIPWSQRETLRLILVACTKNGETRTKDKSMIGSGFCSWNNWNFRFPPKTNGRRRKYSFHIIWFFDIFWHVQNVCSKIILSLKLNQKSSGFFLLMRCQIVSDFRYRSKCYHSQISIAFGKNSICDFSNLKFSNVTHELRNTKIALDKSDTTSLKHCKP